MSPSYEHEAYGALLGRMIEILTEELNIPIKAGKSTTFRRLDLDRGLEPDECYYIDNAARLLGKAEIDLRRDPPPDLAIEVDITSSSLDRMGVYAALGVPELWRFDGQSLQVYRLGPKGAYEPVDRSPNFPSLPPAEVVGFLHQSLTTDDTSLARSFRAWVRERIVPTWKGSRGAAPD